MPLLAIITDVLDLYMNHEPWFILPRVSFRLAITHSLEEICLGRQTQRTLRRILSPFFALRTSHWMSTTDSYRAEVTPPPA